MSCDEHIDNLPPPEMLPQVTNILARLSEDREPSSMGPLPLFSFFFYTPRPGFDSISSAAKIMLRNREAILTPVRLRSLSCLS